MSRRSRIAIAIVAVAVPFACAYAWNVWRNVESLGRMERACARVRAARATAWSALEPSATTLFEDDLALVRSIFDELGEESCVGVPRAIGSPLAWRWGATWSGTPWPEERLDALRAAADRARARCPAIMTEALAALGGDDPQAVARDACEQMMQSFDAYSAAPREALAPIPLWDWPAQMEHLAGALESLPPS